MAQDSNSGFTLPSPSNGTAPQTRPGTTATEVSIPSSLDIKVMEDTGSRDLMIGGGILIVLLIAFFFAKNAYANTLVGKRVPPNKANTAGWWLFICLASLSTAAVLAAVSPMKFMTPMVLGPLGGVGVLSLVLALVSGRK
ncbi:hypothetical protein [Comamonas jiangduensis]|uniref:hypothetical protein n=1 Tax=Comamonas jiangduensis TaxID=1194168 RepID=UPI003BF7B669